MPSAFDVIGIANATASVTVNSSAADYRRGEYFQELASVNNSSTSVWQNVSVTTSGGGTNTGNVFVPTATETYGHDADGNMANDGRWTFTWDAENRLLSMQALSSVPSGAKKKLDFTYDFQGRRIQKIVSTWNGSAYMAASTNKFLYDGWNLLAELNSTNGVVRTYLWGTDLSGGLQWAGGVGGLLAIKPTGANPTFAAYDGNGNVSGLIDATTGTTSGQFEYGPFGETIRLTPNANNQSPFRFSTKYTDDESDFLYYGFRYYNPSTGRWLSRDRLEEKGGANLFSFVANDPLMSVDLLGLDTVEWRGSVMYGQGLAGGVKLSAKFSDSCCPAGSKKKKRHKAEIFEEVWIGVGIGVKAEVAVLGFTTEIGASFKGPNLTMKTSEFFERDCDGVIIGGGRWNILSANFEWHPEVRLTVFGYGVGGEGAMKVGGGIELEAKADSINGGIDLDFNLIGSTIGGFRGWYDFKGSRYYLGDDNWSETETRKNLLSTHIAFPE